MSIKKDVNTFQSINIKNTIYNKIKGRINQPDYSLKFLFV